MYIYIYVYHLCIYMYIYILTQQVNRLNEPSAVINFSKVSTKFILNSKSSSKLSFQNLCKKFYLSRTCVRNFYVFRISPDPTF